MLSGNTIFIALMVGALAGFIDTVAGGGGLLAVPALLGFGVPPVMALGTNRLQSCIGELIALFRYLKYRSLKFSDIRLGLLSVAFASGAGTLLAESISPGVIKKLVLILIPLLFLFIVNFNRMTRGPLRRRMRRPTFLLWFGLAIGFYNGGFGPNTGVFWVAALMLVLGLDLKSAIITMKPLNLMGNGVSLAFFMWAGQVNFSIGMVMGLGQIIGALLGSNFVVNQNEAVVRRVFLTIVFVIVSLLFKKIYFS